MMPRALLHAALRRIVDVRAGEIGALLGSFAYFFCLLCSYYILRPVREEMGIAGGVKNLPWLFTGTFVAMLAASPLYAAAVARWPRRRFIPLVYRFFTLNILVFYALLREGLGYAHAARAFYIWTGVFNLFVVSVFWGFMADLWRSEQSKRLFGFIAAGGSAGAIVGPLVARLLVHRVGVVNLLLVSAAVLELAALSATWLARASAAGAGGGTRRLGDERVGRGLWSGLKPVFRSPYLLGISGVTLFTTLTSTVLYWQQMHVISAQIGDRNARTALFADIDLYTNALSITVQALVAGRVLQRAGVFWALAAVPIVSALGFVGLALRPEIAVFVAFQVARRAVHYGLERPGREVLFTAVRPEEKYTSKGFIDTVVYRGGDAASVWAADTVAPLIGAAALSLSMLPLIGAWVALNAWLARRQARMVEEQPGGAP